MKKLIATLLAITMALSLFGCENDAGHSETTLGTDGTDASSEATEPAGTTKATEPDGTESEVHEHNYTSVVTAPTCTAAGYTTFTCACGDEYVAGETEATGHDYANEVVQPTYEAEGYTVHTCSVCGDSYKSDYTDKLERETEPVETRPAETEPEATVYYVPEGCTYIMADGTELQAGEAMPSVCSDGDELITEAYIYKYGYEYRFDLYNGCYFSDSKIAGWGVGVQNRSLTEYPELLSQINGQPLMSMSATFASCGGMKESPAIPNSVKYMDSTFWACSSLTTSPMLPEGVTSMEEAFNHCTNLVTVQNIPSTVTNLCSTFNECSKLVNVPQIPEGVTNMSYTFSFCGSLTDVPDIPSSVHSLAGTFTGCFSLTVAPVIPDTVTSLDYTFGYCEALTTVPVIPASITSMKGTFTGCTALTGTIEINATPTAYTECFAGTKAPIVLTGSSKVLAELAATSANGNVTVFGANDPSTTVYYVPEGCTYTTADGTTLRAGEAIPVACSDGDTLYAGDYIYKYGYEYDEVQYSGDMEGGAYLGPQFVDSDIEGWGVCVRNVSKTSYSALLSEINGMPVLSLQYTFFSCREMTEAPAIPGSVTNLSQTFYCCYSLAVAPEIPEGVTNMTETFSQCGALVLAPVLPSTVIDLTWTFEGCYSLTTAPVIPVSVRAMGGTFYGCRALTGTIEIHATPTDYTECFAGTEAPIVLTGSSKVLAELAATSVKGNVSVK